jgi:transcriptional regulator with XRE-family HTH domain
VEKEFSSEEIIKLQVEWLDEIKKKTGLTTHALAQKVDVASSTLTSFYSANALGPLRKLSNVVIKKLYDHAGIKPSFPFEFEQPDEANELLKTCREYVESCRKERSYATHGALAKEANIPASTLSRLFSGATKKALSMPVLEKLEKHTGLPIPAILRTGDKGDGARLPVTGSVNFETGDIVTELQSFHYAPILAGVAPSSGGRAIRVEKAGANIPFMKEGSLLYYNNVASGVANHCISSTCVVKVKGGKICIKGVSLSHEDGKYTLRSVDGMEKTTAELEWATPILWVKQLKSNYR